MMVVGKNAKQVLLKTSFHNKLQYEKENKQKKEDKQNANKKKKGKLYEEERIIRMESEEQGLVVIINNSGRFKAKQNVLREPKVFKSPFECFYAQNLEEWTAKYPNENRIQLTIKMKRHWDQQLTEQQKSEYITLSQSDKARFNKEMRFWRTVEWMNQKPYE